jgi:PhzF family phenazine biosynthesis protein
MTIPVYQVDAFTGKIFGGNPAAVCPLQEWLPETLMQQIGMENNLSETAFVVKEGDAYRIRWFTPAVEVDLCGHATLAAAYVIFRYLAHAGDEITFLSKSGILKVNKEADGKLTLDFPASSIQEVPQPPACILDGLSLTTAQVFKGSFDYMVLLDTQLQVEELKPDFRLLAQASSRGVIVTAPGAEADFVSRCFYPQSGIDEDPVTGSAHTMLTPFWAERSGKTKLSAIQLSARRGYLDCELANDRVKISGYAIIFLRGEIEL